MAVGTKAFDPFSDRKASKTCKNAWREFNLPPTTQNHVAQRHEAKAARERAKGTGKKIQSRRKALPQWVQDDLKATAKMERREGNMGIEPNSVTLKENDGELEDVSAHHHVPLPSVMPPSKRRHGELEAQQPDECLADFKARVRKAKFQSLKEEHRRTSSSTIKKKAFLTEKKKRNKKFKTTTDKPLQGCHEDSVTDDEVNFLETEHLRFGETADAPPRLSTTPKSRKERAPEGKPWTRKQKRHQQKELTEEGKVIKAREMEKLRDEVAEAYNLLKKKRQKTPLTMNL